MRIPSLLRKFARQDAGNVGTMLALMCVPLILISGGGLDLMMHERERVRLQDALDGGLIAAAALTQPKEAEATIRSYLTAAGFTDVALTITEKRSLGSRNVNATATKTIRTAFLKLGRIDELTVSASGTAEEAVKNIEISFVLDLSGSMRGARINAMRPAAKNFIASLLSGKNKDFTSISLIPYAGQVNVGHVAYDAFGGTAARRHDKSSCYSNLETKYTEAIPEFETQDQVPQFSTWKVGTNTGFDPWNCPTEETSISYISNESAALQARIDGYHMFDGTGTHISMKWGLHLLDPNFRNTLAKAKSRGVTLVDSKFADRPSAYGDTRTLKVIVLMTDGEVVDQQRPVNGAYVNPQPETLDPNPNKQALKSAIALDNMVAACKAAQERGVVVYAIGFEVATSNASFLTKLKSCASSPDRYYDAKTSDISRIFQDVAQSISPLRLVN